MQTSITSGQFEALTCAGFNHLSTEEKKDYLSKMLQIDSESREEQEKAMWDVLLLARRHQMPSIEELAYQILVQISDSRTTLRIIYDTSKDPSTRKAAEEKYLRH